MRAALITSVTLLVAMGFAPITSASEHPLVETCEGTEVGVVVNATDDVYREACLTTVETCEGSQVGLVLNATDDTRQTVCLPQPVEPCENDVGVVVTTPDGTSAGVCGLPNAGTCGDVGVQVAGEGICFSIFPICIGPTTCLF